MVTSGKKSGFDVAMEEIETAEKSLGLETLAPAKKKQGPDLRKLPFLDWYLVRGAEIRRRQESKKIKAKMAGILMRENTVLRRRLARYEG